MTTVTRPNGRSTWEPLFPYATAVIALAGLVLGFFAIRFTTDDAFITFRYGRTLVEHGVWNWDSGLPAVEAYTNPIYAFVSIVPPLLGLGSEFFFKLVSLAILIALVVWIARQRELSRWVRLLAVALVVVNPAFHLHLWSGLETPLFVALLTVLFVRVARDRDLGWWGVLLCCLLALTRPEGLGFAVVAAGWSYLARPQRRRLIPLAVVVGFIVVYWTTRAVYFGKLFPNTFYVKSAAGGLWGTLVTLGWVALSVGVLTVVIALLARTLRNTEPGATSADAPLAALRRGWQTADRASWTPVVYAVAAAGVALVLNRTSDLLMNYVNRFEWQLLMPLVLILLLTPAVRPRVAAVASLVTVIGMASNLLQVSKPQVLALLVVLALIAAVVWARRTWLPGAAAGAAPLLALLLGLAVSYLPADTFISFLNYRPRLEDTHVALGRILAESDTEQRVVALGDAGAIPFYSDWTVYDEYGLANPYITDGTFEEVLHENPPSIILLNAGTNTGPLPAGMPEAPGEVAMVNDFAIDPANGYEFLPGLRFQSAYRMHIYLHPSVDAETRAELVRLTETTTALHARGEENYFARNWRTIPFLKHITD